MTDVVIGAASGMGEAVARRFAAGGRRLLVADIDADAVGRLAADLGEATEALHCDLTEVTDLEALAQAAGTFGRLVLTAGLSPTMAPGRRIYEVDLVGPARMLDVFLPHSAHGSVAVILASMAGHLPPDDAEIDAALDRPLAPSLVEDLTAAGVDVDDSATAYMYAKRGAIRLARRSAHAWGERGARVVSLSPGIIDTPMGRQENEAQPVMAQMVEESPLRRMIEPDEIAAVVEFLTSPAAIAITGTDVLVDGGVVARLTTPTT